MGGFRSREVCSVAQPNRGDRWRETARERERERVRYGRKSSLRDELAEKRLVASMSRPLTLPQRARCSILNGSQAARPSGVHLTAPEPRFVHRHHRAESSTSSRSRATDGSVSIVLLFAEVESYLEPKRSTLTRNKYEFTHFVKVVFCMERRCRSSCRMRSLSYCSLE